MATLQSTTVATQMTSGGNVVWHANNDGNGSGLNAQYIGGYGITHLDVKARITTIDLTAADRLNFIPLTFWQGGWGSGMSELSVRKSYVHQGGSGAGALYGRFRYRSSQWGHHGFFWEMEDNWGGGFNYPYIGGMGNLGQNDQCAIWLRGATQYYYQFNNTGDYFQDTSTTTSKTVSESNGTQVTWSSYQDASVGVPGNSRYVSHHIVPKTTGFSVGTSTYRWNAVYAVAENNTSDERYKENFGLVLGSEFLRKLKPKTYIRKAPYEVPTDTEFTVLREKPDGDRRNVGFIAQEVKAVLDELGIPETDFGGYDGRDPSHLSLHYSEFIPVIVKSLQEKKAFIRALRERIKKLEDKQ